MVTIVWVDRWRLPLTILCKRALHAHCDSINDIAWLICNGIPYSHVPHAMDTQAWKDLPNNPPVV